MKKKWFSQPLYYLWQQYHSQTKITPKMDVATFCSLNKQNAARMSSDDSSGIMSGYEMLFEDSIGEMVHVFLNDETLKGFLERTRLADLKGIKRFLIENGKRETIAYLKTNETARFIIYCFGLHIPYENQKEGYAYQIGVNVDNGILELFCLKGEKVYGLNDSHYEALLHAADKSSEEQTRVFRLGLNLLAYMNCFPDCVTNGVPKITVDYGESVLKKTVTVLTTDKVLDPDEKSVKVPHFRRGYWKYCESDFYKEARGQLIFVRETMVKGRAITVEKVDDLSSFK